MENKQIVIDCPCCNTKLTIDVLTCTVMRALTPKERSEDDPEKLAGERWDTAQKRVDKRGGSAGDRLDSALSAEKNKESRLDDLFDKARAKMNRKKNELGE